MKPSDKVKKILKEWDKVPFGENIESDAIGGSFTPAERAILMVLDQLGSAVSDLQGEIEIEIDRD